jgi:ectoine hydroxylase-related dioxygenase (phytanoyl-CoA dioxygenase family)
MSKATNGRRDPKFREIGSAQEYLKQDLGRRFGFTHSEAAAALDAELVDRQHEKLLQDGYIILENVATPDLMDELRHEARPHLEKVGRNSFEGERTQRIYSVPQKLRCADPFITHPLILAHLDRLLLPNYLLSQAQVINVMGHSPSQPLHMDDGFYPWPRPRPALSAATVFAIDDFTAENGATRAIPGSHLWPEGRVPEPGDRTICAEMSAGSCILFLGNLWHGAGENTTGTDRLAFTGQYCEPWVRTQENYFLSTDLDLVAALSEDMKRLLGYSIHPPFMGMVDGMHPKRKLPVPDVER